MKKKIGLVATLVLGISLVGCTMNGQSKPNNTNVQESTTTAGKENSTQSKKVKPVEKSAAAKQAVMEADADTMNSLGLYFDYANMSLEEVVKAYMAEYGIADTDVAFSYENTKTGETFSMNDTQPMTAGSTYKLPLNMKIVDKVEEGIFSMDQAYDITNITYEYQGEYDAYRAQFGDDMTIAEMQEYSILYSENTPAHAMIAMMGGDWQKIYDTFTTYGKSKADIKTINMEMGNKTTSDFYIQLLNYLYHHQEKYADILSWMDQSFTGLYYEGLQPDLHVIQKPGYVREALNVDAIVEEETPYLIALYTRYLGGSDENTEEINGYGYYELTQICYVINEWHRVNMNPTPVGFDASQYTTTATTVHQESESELQTPEEEVTDALIEESEEISY
ncbi:serine hydrolase [Streptococcus caprae]|uniref:Serine hydrolase n=1 Tax=Streptococcus caprae TaxID=1640501 RepID=A0ABV8CYV0_9STRE